LPTLHRKQFTPSLQDISHQSIIQKLSELCTLGGQSSFQRYLEHNLYITSPFHDWPLAILLTVQQDLGLPNQKSIIKQHLLVAQIPTRFSHEKAPLLEWRLGPSSEQNKNNPDITLSQVFLTLDKSLNSPQNAPTMRLWLSGTLNGSRKRLLIAYSKEDFNKQLKATELLLPRTQLCQNTSAEFHISVLPGIHFYQSDIPYVHVNQDNIWTLWTPSAELLASTPGREKINPPPPSPRNQSTSQVTLPASLQHIPSRETCSTDAALPQVKTIAATETEAILCKKEADEQCISQHQQPACTLNDQDNATDTSDSTLTTPTTEQLVTNPPLYKSRHCHLPQSLQLRALNNHTH